MLYDKKNNKKKNRFAEASYHFADVKYHFAAKIEKNLFCIETFFARANDHFADANWEKLI